MAPFRRALRHRPVAHQHRHQASAGAYQRARRNMDRDYLAQLRHLR